LSEPELPATTNPRYVLYDFDADQLATTQLFDTFAEAAEAADRLQNILIVPIVIPAADPDVSDEDESADQRCDCERPGFFHCGVAGIIAHFENSRLAPGASVERCDLCERYPTDEAARQKLVELGLAEPTSV
jgi:hypothetical protein